MRSAIYNGTVMHQRHSPLRHRFEYRIGAWLIDLAELPELDRSLPLFGWNRFSLFSFYDVDFGLGDGTSPAEHVRKLLADEGLAAPCRTELLCYPRLLGYAFNPIAIYFCYDDSDNIIAVLHEVTNTFGDRHTYIVKTEGERQVPRHSADKQLHVSPFLPMQGRYHFRIQRPGETVTVAIRETRSGETILTAAFRGQRRALSGGRLLRQFLSMPLMTVKVTAGIHWEALKLWARGLKVYRRPEPGAARSRSELRPTSDR